MSDRSCLARQLTQARQYTERLLADFKTPEEWVNQAHPRANHALWLAGHMGVSDNFFISTIVPERSVARPDFQEKFGPGSQPTNRPEDYPPASEALAYMRDRRAVLLELFEHMTDEDLERPMPKGTPDFLPTYGSIFQMVVWHEGLHSGQISVTRRAMGMPPVMQPPPAL